MRHPLSQLPPVSIEETLCRSVSSVDLWYFHHELHKHAIPAFENLLTADERQRLDSFRFRGAQMEYLATRGLVRNALSAYVNVAPEAWRFESGKYGRPFIARPLTTPALHFNLTNASGLVICAVSVVYDQIGVDVERTDTPRDALEIANRFFTSSELSSLKRLAPDELHRRFLENWTLKESLLKAQGRGLSMPLDSCEFRFGDGHIELRLAHSATGSPVNWRFALLPAPPLHTAAIAVRTAGKPLTLRSVEWSP